MSNPIANSLFDVTGDPDEIKERLLSKQLCFVLNKDLKPRQTAKLAEKVYLMAVEYNGEVRSAGVWGMYKQPRSDYETLPADTKDSPAVEMWMDNGNVPILEVQIENPLCIILSMFLAPIQLTMLGRAVEIINVTYEGHRRQAVACAYYEPDVPIEGGILSQEWRIE